MACAAGAAAAYEALPRRAGEAAPVAAGRAGLARRPEDALLSRETPSPCERRSVASSEHL